MSKKAAVFSRSGLGDGINTLVLSNNLHLNGWQVDTYHKTLGSMQNWIPHLPICQHRNLEELPKILNTYDWLFVVQDDADEFITQLIQEGKRRFSDRIKVIYLYASKNIVNETYYSDCLTNPSISIAENLRVFCERVLHLPKITKSNGFIPPVDLKHRRFEKRIAIHPTSNLVSKNWPKEKFVRLAHYLKEEGFSPVFIPGIKEKEEWTDAGELACFQTLDLLARYLYESGYLIGNDSGLGHLASALGIPTLTFMRRKTAANFWAPSFHKGIVLTPSSWIPNLRGFRIRDRFWDKFVSVGMARRGFEQLLQTRD